MSNLRLINETNVTSASQISVTDVFSSDFDIYKIEFDYSFDVTSNVNARLINSSGSVITSSEYDWAYERFNDYTTFGENRGDNETDWNDFIGKNDSVSGECQNSVGYIFNPYSSDRFTYALFSSANAVNDQSQGMKGVACLTEVTSVTGFQIIFDSYASNNGKIRTYGLRVDS